MAESALGPSRSGSVVLDLGPGLGALVLHTPPELDGQEIEISSDSDPHPHPHRTHSQVRPRHTAGGTQYAAVYPGLAPGGYTIWREPSVPALTVIIAGSEVTTAWWPG
jgi:hypothetical protein